MKLQPDKSDVQTITGYGPGWIGVNGEKLTHSVLIGSQGQRLEWACRRFEDLQASHFAPLADMGAELVIFGSGSRIRFPQPAWLAGLMQRRIGLETMDTAAACRTYNILAGEGRNVVLAALIEPPASA
jgi:uncharacterized protein